MNEKRGNGNPSVSIWKKINTRDSLVIEVIWGHSVRGLWLCTLYERFFVGDGLVYTLVVICEKLRTTPIKI